MHLLIIIILVNIFQGIHNSILSDKSSLSYQTLDGGDNIYDFANPDQIRLSASGINEDSDPKFLSSIAELIKTTRSQMDNGLCPLRNSSNFSSELIPITICCDGYVRIADQCVPICIKGCAYGICTAPNTCTCWPGYKLNDLGRCSTLCVNGCQNGNCDANGQCLCKKGYKMEAASNNTICEPICENDCKYGKCIAPNKCKCDQGFQINSQGDCVLTCSDCENGKCNHLGKCLCNEGYKELDGKCQPDCASNCINGYCSAPGVCICNKGYKLDESGTTCLTDTKLPCVNGFCYGYNLQHRRHIG